MSKEKKEKRFIVQKSEATGMLTETTVIIDSETGVQYLYVAQVQGGGLTVLVDKDGKPLLARDF